MTETLGGARISGVSRLLIEGLIKDGFITRARGVTFSHDTLFVINHDGDLLNKKKKYQMGVKEAQLFKRSKCNLGSTVVIITILLFSD